MPSQPLIFVAISLAILAVACAREAPPEMPAQSSTQRIESDSALPGKAEYERQCARCHEQGVDGAPMTGSRDDWASRSPRWEAVLYEHATGGYLHMPAMGGASELHDRQVEAAAEYMLSVTHPELAPDPQ